MKDVIFITGNQDKADHLRRLLGIVIEHQKIDLDEIQSADSRDIIRHKVYQAYEILKSPVLVDDVSMGLDSLGGLPGPFIKYFVTAENGLKNLCRMADGLANRRATARAYFGLYDGQNVTLLFGEIHGEIAQHPKGDGGFAYGWDKVFCPDGYGGRTRAELTQSEYDEVYQTIRPIEELRKILTSF